MVLRRTWARRRGRTRSPTSPATPAMPLPWTAWPSTPSPWTSWTRAPTTTTAPPARRTPTARASQTTCATAGSGWGSTHTTRTLPPPSRYPPTHRAPLRWATSARRTHSLPLRRRHAPTAPRSDCCGHASTHKHKMFSSWAQFLWDYSTVLAHDPFSCTSSLQSLIPKSVVQTVPCWREPVPCVGNHQGKGTELFYILRRITCGTTLRTWQLGLEWSLRYI